MSNTTNHIREINSSKNSYTECLAAVEKAAQRRLIGHQFDDLDRQEASHVLSMVTRQRTLAQEGYALQPYTYSFDALLCSAKERAGRTPKFASNTKEFHRE